MARVAKDPVLTPQTTTPAATTPAAASAPASTSTTSALQYGATGDDVKSLQTTLNSVGNYNLDVDGSFGPATLAAVKDYQSKNRLDVDGSVGPLTSAALSASTAALSAPTNQAPAAAAPETTAPAEETPAVQEPVVQATQPAVSGADLVSKWLSSTPQVDADAQVSQWKQSVPDVDKAKSDQRALLEQWKTTLLEQSNNQIDYNVAKAITELERALEDAQPQFKEQQETIAKDEMQARDNAALYAEARGDKGGIGAEQYNSIMNTAAQNRLSVQQAQTKLATDTQRQIADLRAQGEFDKADAALEISQQYLSQLMSLEQWAFDAGMSAAQFKITLDQWAADYNMAMAQFKTGLAQWAAEYDSGWAQHQTEVDMWNANFNYQKEQDKITNTLNQAKFDYEKQQNTNSQLISTGEALLAAGIMPSSSQLAAMNMTTAQAQAYIEAAKLAAQNEQELAWAKLNNSSGSDDDSGTEAKLPSVSDAVYKNAEKMLENGKSDEAIYEYLKSVAPENATVYANFLGIEVPETSEEGESEVHAFNLKSEDAKYIYALMKVGGFNYDDMATKLAEADVTDAEFAFLKEMLGRIFYITP